MICNDLITNFISDYLDGTLPPDTLADFEHHLDVCPSCVAYLLTYRMTIAMSAATARAEPGDVPEELVAAILASVK
ncbi:MAG TPA: zf-HC2 domain-containing protein [Thermoanaerobaculia bacterium]|nr:zf-HC2 domain-containing protein [Thermoanaerobaculia bacterium]